MHDNQYNNRNTLENSVLKQLELNGEYLKAGQILQYIITDYDGSLLKRAVPNQLVDYITNYDIKRYSKLLIDTCNTVLKLFGILLTKINYDINKKLLLSLSNYKGFL